MSRAIANEFCAFGAPGKISAMKRSSRSGNSAPNSRILHMNGKKIASKQANGAKVSFVKVKPIFLLVGLVLLLSFSYLYQVNDLATKGFEVRELEKKIQDLEKDSKKMQIREVELRSMYNIEKFTKDLDLVSPENITYVEMDGPLAMK
jgi:hypothetical protein